MAAETGRYRTAVSKNKDPSGLLISVIRTLSSSDDVQDRETEKGRLEEAFETCDRDLDEQIVQHYAELTTAIRTYQSITERITSSRNKIKQVKENLLSCKMLLHCKRDELRKLWIEGIEHKHVLQLLDEIESIKQVPQRLEAYMASKHYLHATDMLVSAVDSLEGPLLQVEGLGDLRLELHSKKLNIHLVLIDELHRHLYIKSTSRLGHKNKDKNAARLPGSAAKDTSPMPVLDVSSMSTPRKLLDTSQFSTPGSGSVREQDVRELNQADLTEVDPEENSAEFMGILIKALAKLKKIPETIKAIMERLEPELKQIVKRSTTQIADHAYQRGENLAQESKPRLLLELLELLFDKFKAVAQAHSVVLTHLQQIAVQCPGGAHQEGIKLYEQADVSAKIQTVLQVLLMEYLDVKNSRSATEPSAQLSYASTGSEFAAFFSKKKPQRAKQSLFKFESSSHAISMSAYLREQRRELYSKSGELQGGADDNLIEGGEMKFVCKPGARNITVIFQPLLSANEALFLADGFLMAELWHSTDGSPHLLQPAMQLMAALMTEAVGGLRQWKSATVWQCAGIRENWSQCCTANLVQRGWHFEKFQRAPNPSLFTIHRMTRHGQAVSTLERKESEGRGVTERARGEREQRGKDNGTSDERNEERMES
ncbi:Exocyst complex component 4 [Dissostichus eleginoides]|nr:Exocyst complex component 4 [Dissostichus eleginoides]